MSLMMSDLSTILGGLIETSIAMTGADFGNIQLLDAQGHLRIVAHRGFPDWWIAFWNDVTVGTGACGTALLRGERVVVEDVEHSPIFLGTPALDVMRRAGIRGIQSTPLMSHSGQLLGMLSTHTREPFHSDERMEKVLNLLANHAATIIERERLAAALRITDERFLLAMDAAEEGIWDYSTTSGEVYFSPGYARMLGYETGELQPSIAGWIALLHPDESEVISGMVRKRLRESGFFALEFRMRKKDGNYAWIFCRGRAVQFDANGRATRVIGSNMDITARKKAEQAIHDSEMRLRLFIEQAPVALAMLDREMHYLAVSRRWFDDYSLGNREIIGHSHYEIFPEINGAWKSVHRRALAGETIVTDEDRFVRADGTIQWLRWKVLPWRLSNGTVGGILIFTEDISARKNAEEIIQVNENRLKRAQKAAQIGTWEWDVITNATHWSDEAYDLYGVLPGEVLPNYENWLATMAPADRISLDEQIQACLARGAEFELEWRTADHRGDGRWLLSRGQPEFDDEGKLVRYLGIVMDITERKKASEALEEARSRLAEAQRMAHLGSFEYNVQDETTVWSDEQYRIHGFPPGGTSPALEEILAHSILPEDKETLRSAFIDAIANQRLFEQEHRLVRKNGEIRWVHTLAHPYYDDQGNLLRYVGTTLDITERKRSEAEAQKQSEMMQAMVRQQVAVQTAAAFAHELNQPLGAIAAYNEVALRSLRGVVNLSSKVVRAIEGSRDQALRAGDVLHELIAHLHKTDFEPKPFDLNGLVEEVIRKLRKEEFRSFRATLELDKKLPQVHGNRLQTEKVLLNLIQNGIDAMEEAGISPAAFTITVRTMAGRDMAHVTVRDCGPGIDDETARRVFEPFFSTKHNGLGLGLPISRSLIEAQDGQLWLDPEAGPGAVFHFTLPFSYE